MCLFYVGVYVCEKKRDRANEGKDAERKRGGEELSKRYLREGEGLLQSQNALITPLCGRFCMR